LVFAPFSPEGFSKVLFELSEPGKVYLVPDGSVFSSEGDITALPDNQWNVVTVETVDAAARPKGEISVEGLLSGNYRLLAVDKTGNLSEQVGVTFTKEGGPFVIDTTAPNFVAAQDDNTVINSLAFLIPSSLDGAPFGEVFADEPGVTFQYTPDIDILDGGGIGFVLEEVQGTLQNTNKLESFRAPFVIIANEDLQYLVNDGLFGELTATDPYGNSSTIPVSFKFLDDSVIVFDTQSGESSSHSSRTLSEDESYKVYVIVKGSDESAELNSPPAWSGSLGPDDKVYLVSDGNELSYYISPFTEGLEEGPIAAVKDVGYFEEDFRDQGAIVWGDAGFFFDGTSFGRVKSDGSYQSIDLFSESSESSLADGFFRISLPEYVATTQGVGFAG